MTMNKLIFMTGVMLLTTLTSVVFSYYSNPIRSEQTATSEEVKSITFDGYYTYAIKAPSLQQPMMMDIWYQNNGDMWALSMNQQGTKMTYLVDGEDVSMLVDAQGQKSKMSSPMVAQKFNQFTPDLPDGAEINKTGESKKIGNYQCDTYEVTAEGKTSKMYVSNEVDLKGGFFHQIDEVDGTVLGMEADGTDSGVIMFVSQNEGKSMTINTDDYNSMGQ